MEVKLTKGKVAIVDDIDFGKVSEHKWYYSDGYARRTLNKEKTHIKMHRFIIGAKNGQYVDHINGNKLDNRRSNLRICTVSQNNMNRNIQKNNKHGHTGLHLVNSKQQVYWQPRITVNKKSISLGSFKNKADAIKAYDLAKVKYFGPYSKKCNCL